MSAGEDYLGVNDVLIIPDARLSTNAHLFGMGVCIQRNMDLVSQSTDQKIGDD